MKQRILTALWALPVLLLFIWFDTPWFPIIIILISALVIVGILEFYRLALLSQGHPLITLGLVWALIFVIAAHFETAYLPAAVVGSAIIVPGVLAFALRREKRLSAWAWTVAGILYIGWTLSHYVSLRELDFGRNWVILAIFSTFACDTSAFLIGKKFGHRRFAPAISPGKTWEGAIAGLLVAMAAVVALRFILNIGGWTLPMGYLHSVILGLLIGVFAQTGDLLESLMKRKAGVKDSGTLLRGHGGVLDRIDSLVLTGVIVYYYVIWVVE
jgi:phosphatidate cytidylyltransferase